MYFFCHESKATFIGINDAFGFEVKDEIEILESFKSNSKSKVILKKGKIFVIKYVDESGDITVNDGLFEKNQWIRKKNFHKIIKLDPRPPQNQVSIVHFKSCFVLFTSPGK